MKVTEFIKISSSLTSLLSNKCVRKAGGGGDVYLQLPEKWDRCHMVGGSPGTLVTRWKTAHRNAAVR